jgi:leucyl aminopeptidase
VLAAQRYGVDLTAVAAAEKVVGRAGEVVRVPVQAPQGLPARLLLVGVGAGAPPDLRRSGAALARAVRGRDRLITSLADGRADDATRALVEGLLLGGYTLPAAGLKNRADSAAVRQAALIGDVPETAVEVGRVHALATIRVRDLAAIPSNIKHPVWLAEQAVAGAEEAGLAVRVWDEDDLAADGFGGLLAVGGGSATPPRLVRLDYQPPAGGRRGGGRVVLVGKGVTYDTGGLSIKPREAMVPMKTDMAGAAAVLATLLACPRLGVRRPVTGLLALAENAVATAGGERVWRMPLVEDYRPWLDSSVADLRHIATDPKSVGGGAILAALFLREFTGGRRWAHLDIAGTGRCEQDAYELTRGPTGYGVRLLLRWLEALR